MLGHVGRDLAVFLARQMDAGLALDCYVDGGTREGAWSVNLRLEGPAAEAAALAEAEGARRWSEHVQEQHDVAVAAGACEVLAPSRPGEGWDAAAYYLRQGDRLGGPFRPERPHDYEIPRQWMPAYKTRLADLEHAYGVKDERARAAFLVEVGRHRRRLERLGPQLRAKGGRKAWSGRGTELENAAQAVQHALEALARLEAGEGAAVTR